MKYRCNICNVFEYDDSRGDSNTNIIPGTSPKDFPEDWRCPICQADKTHLKPMQQLIRIKKEEEAINCPSCGKEFKITISIPEKVDAKDYLGEWKRDSDKIENHMADIHRISVSGESIIEPMRDKKAILLWDDVLIKGAQLSRLPLK